MTGQWRRGWLGKVLALSIAGLSITVPAGAAERIHLSYPPLGLSVPIRELEIYAQQGRPTGRLATYFNSLRSIGSRCLATVSAGAD